MVAGNRIWVTKTREAQRTGDGEHQGPEGTWMAQGQSLGSPGWDGVPGMHGEPKGTVSASLSTCSMMVASACPAGLVALQMYWPESCWATWGMTSVSPSSRCCQGSGERSLDQWMVGVGLPVGSVEDGIGSGLPQGWWSDLPCTGPLSGRFAATMPSSDPVCLHLWPQAPLLCQPRGHPWPHLWLSNAGWQCAQLPRSAQPLRLGPVGPLGLQRLCPRSPPHASEPCPGRSGRGTRRCPRLMV